MGEFQEYAAALGALAELGGEGAWFTWLDGHVEAVEVLAVRGDRAYLAWPESRRTVEGSSLFPPLPAGPVEVERPAGWMPIARLSVSCSAYRGGDPAGGCDELAPFGVDYCDRHAAEVA